MCEQRFKQSCKLGSWRKTKREMKMKFEEKTYYKVCYEIAGENYSSHAYDIRFFSLKYAIGEVTKPPPGTLGIFVFGSMVAVRKFYPKTASMAFARAHVKLFACKVQGPVIRAIVVPEPPYWVNSSRDMDHLLFWRMPKHLSRKQRLARVKSSKKKSQITPDGTYSVGAVRLVRPVHLSEIYQD